MSVKKQKSLVFVWSEVSSQEYHFPKYFSFGGSVQEKSSFEKYSLNFFSGNIL